MSAKPDETDGSYRARIPADIDTPDKIVYGLTARQLAFLSVAAMVGYLLTHAFGGLLPMPAMIALLIPLAGVAIVVALGRRDGLPLDTWIVAGIRHSRGPRQLVATPSGAVPPSPAWAPAVAGLPVPGVLRLPARAIADNGVIDTGATAVTLVAASTVNIRLRTRAEQAALIDAYGRWLNGLTAPVQLVMSTQRVDLARQARRVADRAASLPPELRAAACDYATFLQELAEQRDPLWRTVTAAVTAPAGAGGDTLRRAQRTAAALTALGARTVVLDGAQATGVLTVAVDPYTPTDVAFPRHRPGGVLTSNGDVS